MNCKTHIISISFRKIDKATGLFLIDGNLFCLDNHGKIVAKRSLSPCKQSRIPSV